MLERTKAHSQKHSSQRVCRASDTPFKHRNVITLIKAPVISAQCNIAHLAAHHFGNLAGLSHLWWIATTDTGAGSATHKLPLIFCSHPPSEKKRLHIFDNDKLWAIEESKDSVTLLENHILDKYLHDMEDVTGNVGSSTWTAERLAGNLISPSAAPKVSTALVFSPRTAETAILPPANQMRTDRKGTSKTHAKYLVPLISVTDLQLELNSSVMKTRSSLAIHGNKLMTFCNSVGQEFPIKGSICWFWVFFFPLEWLSLITLPQT